MRYGYSNISGLVVMVPDVKSDGRGFFLESYSQQRCMNGGITAVFIQDNHCLSVKKWTLRGLHFQIPPFAQNKLVRVTRGSVYDVVVDLRKKSPTFGRWKSFILSGKNFRQLYVPAGFAHGFCTLEKDTEVLYKVDRPYSPEHVGGIIWNDRDLKIDWPTENPHLSDRDSSWPSLKKIPKFF